MEHKRLTEAICRIGRQAIAIALAWIGHEPTCASQIILTSHVDTAEPRLPALLRLLYGVGLGCKQSAGWRADGCRHRYLREPIAQKRQRLPLSTRSLFWGVRYCRAELASSRPLPHN